MVKTNLHTLFYWTILLLCGTPVFAQQGVYVPKNGKVYFKGDTATIFSDVQNKGKVRIGKKAVVQFKGKKWENDAEAEIIDEENTGLIRFLTPEGTGDLQQVIIGGYNAATKSGAQFSRVSIHNPFGVLLLESSFKVKKELIFEQGHLFATEQLIAMGDETGPGTISGYNQQRFIVTGTHASGGFLLMENISDKNGEMVFPVGSDVYSYTPAAITLKTPLPDDIYVHSWKGVKKALNSGDDLAASGVNTSWQIGKLKRPLQDDVLVRLQHLLQEEGVAGFVPNRNRTYISLFDQHYWDTSGEQSTPLSPAYLSTGAAVANSGTNSRMLSGKIGTATGLTKFAAPPKDTALFQTKFRFWGYRRIWNQVELNWTTRPEFNIRHFVLQRRYSNEADFTNIATVVSKAIGGSSHNLLTYHYKDPNTYSGVTYYRLILVDYNGSSVFSNIVPIDPAPGGYGIFVWPNPSSGRFVVGISGVAPVKSIVVWNVLGQKIMEEPVSNRNSIPMEIHMPGTYFVGSVTFGGRIIETKKIIISGK